MQTHLHEISLHVTAGRVAALLLDQAGWHTTEKLTIPSIIVLIYLPPKSPEPETTQGDLRRPLCGAFHNMIAASSARSCSNPRMLIDAVLRRKCCAWRTCNPIHRAPRSLSE